jgi:hypothetical protein
MLAGDAFVGFGTASLIIGFDPARAVGALTALGFLGLLASIALMAPYAISIGAQGFKAAFPTLGPSAAWVGLRGMAMVIAIALAIMLPASTTAAVSALVAGVILAIVLRAGG